jgi:hypothetical protein
MFTALDAPDDALDENERKFVRNIREYGWFNNRILPEDDLPGFNFTTGFQVTIGKPELIVFDLPQETAHSILWECFRRMKEGLILEAGKPYDEFLERFAVHFQPVDKAHYYEHLGWSRWFYGNDDFDCWQMIWPDKAGLFPWQAGYEERFLTLQPDLSSGNWNGLKA